MDGDSSVNYDVDVRIDEANDSRHGMSDLHESVWWTLVATSGKHAA